ncbi:hypothetical protein ACVMGC_001024 [Bradyrhizobium barranii subsp. barranii]|uniref:head-tail joining protein n=1 Tax=Bradyrhizobium TaxID=374 RepID=UPI001BAD1911|nr:MULTISPECIES: hypothetical protein [Bradyrhizobium]MBR0879624.1 hypothetical protein [Bradyrhizobium liaoningense]MCP1778822.1 hypothetical protein [Bradyrhizobium japonicum]MCP1958180.1 hypothetical protein [Bradyrhizobium japonicum]
MAVNMDVLLQPSVFNVFAIPVTFVPLVSQPGAGNYAARGILNTYPTDVNAMDSSVYSDQRTILDIRDSEFAVMPLQNDQVIIPFDSNGVPKGTYQITDSNSDGGGQTMLEIRKIDTRIG